MCVVKRLHSQFVLRRKKKCDQVYPICGHCSRLNLLCKREAPRQLKSTSPSPENPSSTNNTTPSACLHCSRKEVVRIAQLCKPLDLVPNGYSGGESTDLAVSRRSMLRYYTVTLAFLLTTNLENNCFLSGL